MEKIIGYPVGMQPTISGEHQIELNIVVIVASMWNDSCPV